MDMSQKKIVFKNS